jgi:stage V sporulation protein D (sporulation-specific penicillin-binding protein)
VRQVISEETSATVRELLEYVVSEGTGKNGQVAGYRIGGKTGTADKANTKTSSNPKGDVVVSFLCFAPADDPQIIMLLTLDTPSRNTGTYVSGGNMVAPTASSIMADILPYLGINPQYTEEEAASVDATVPYLVDMTQEQAVAKLEEYGFSSYKVVGDGDAVTDQTPSGGAIVPVGAQLILYMGEEKSDAPCTVPNVVGMTPSQANTALTNAGLILKITGTTDTGSGIKAMSQSVEAGTEVEAGTVITVQMGQQSTTAD